MKIPQSQEAEAVVLGAVLLRNELYDAERVSDLQPDDFHRTQHAAVWGATRTLLHQGDPVDLVTLEQQLQATEELRLVGGFEGLTRLLESLRHVPTHNVSHHAGTLLALSRARKAQRTLSEAVDEAGSLDPRDVMSWLADVGQRVASLQVGAGDGFRSLADVVDAAVQEARDRHDGKRTPFSWGLEALDRRFDGGLGPGELVIVAGRPGMGKTVLGLDAMLASARRREVPLMFELEMRDAQVGRRAIASQGEISLSDTKDPRTDNAWSRMVRGRDEVSKLGGKIWIARLTLPRLIAGARTWARNAGTRRGPIIVDYLQLLESAHEDRRLPREQQVARISRELKLLALELEVPVVLLCQLNRDAEKREDKRPRLADLRESGAIEQDADSVVLLYRPRVYDVNAPATAAEAIVAKCREGVPGTVHLEFEGHFSRFLDRKSNDVGGESAPGMEWNDG